MNLPLTRIAPSHSPALRIPDSDWLRAWRRRRAETGDIPAATLGVETRSPKQARLEAALFVADGPLAPRKLAQVASLADSSEVRFLLDQLNASYDRTRSPFRVELLATGYRLLTRARFAPWLDRLHQRQAHLRLSSPMLETLAVVAYRQPITRADVEAVRGVQSAEMLKQLMEKGLVRIVGEDQSLGRPYLYGTTRLFQEQYGLTTLDELPNADRLRRVPETPATAAVPAA
jgi:segregation and condensation protein B